MDDELITELIAAMIMARLEGNGTLTINAVRERLKAAGLRVERVKESDVLGAAG